jgi:hypothetical protein
MYTDVGELTRPDVPKPREEVRKVVWWRIGINQSKKAFPTDGQNKRKKKKMSGIRKSWFKWINYKRDENRTRIKIAN